MRFENIQLTNFYGLMLSNKTGFKRCLCDSRSFSRTCFGRLRKNQASLCGQILSNYWVSHLTHFQYKLLKRKFLSSWYSIFFSDQSKSSITKGEFWKLFRTQSNPKNFFRTVGYIGIWVCSKKVFHFFGPFLHISDCSKQSFLKNFGARTGKLF